MATHFTRDYAMAFGIIIHTYARIEGYLKYIMAHMLGSTLVRAWIVCEPYGAQNIRNVVKSLNQEMVPQREYNERLKHLIGEFGTFGKLRNQIAHFMWANGNRPGSIKPMGGDIRDRKAKLIGIADDDLDYDLEDLKAEVAKLEKLDAKFCEFMEDMGVFEHVSDMVEDANPQTE